MATNRVKNISHYDSYGRQITRGSEMLRKVNCDCYTENMQSNSTMGVVGNTDYSTCNCGTNTSTMSLESVKYNGCCSLYNSLNNTSGTGNNGTGQGTDSNKPNCSINNAFYFKYHNLRIRYVGFLFCNVNYIVDIDNRKVLYKSIKESTYTTLDRKISVSTNSITKAYTVAFNLVGCRYHAETEIYPNNIDKCTVTITDLDNYNKEMLDKCYTNIEFFDIKNMLDSNGNLITYIDYSDIFSLSEEDISSIFTYPDAIALISTILNNVSSQKDLVYVIKQLLVTIRNKWLEESSNNCECGCMNDTSVEGNEYPVDEDTEITCNCGCNNSNNKPSVVLPNGEFDYKSILPQDIAGTYIADNGDSFTLDINQGILRVRALRLGYTNDNGDRVYLVTDTGQTIGTEEQYSYIDGVTWKEEFMIDDHFNVTGILVKFLDSNNNTITTLQYKPKKKYLICIDDPDRIVYKKEYTGELNMDLSVNFTIVNKRGKKEVLPVTLYTKGIMEEVNNNEDSSVIIPITIPDTDYLNYILIEVNGKINDSIITGINLVTGEEYDYMIDMNKDDNKIYGVVKITDNIFDVMLNDEKLVIKFLPNKDATEEVIHTIHFKITDI